MNSPQAGVLLHADIPALVNETVDARFQWLPRFSQ